MPHVGILLVWTDHTDRWWSLMALMRSPCVLHPTICFAAAQLVHSSSSYLLFCSPTFLSEGVSLSLWVLCFLDPPLCKSCGASKASHAVFSFPPPYRRTYLVVTSAVPCSPFPFCLYTPTHIIFLRWSHPLVCKSCPAVMISLILSICPFYFHLKWSKIKIHLLLTSSDAGLQCIRK